MSDVLDASLDHDAAGHSPLSLAQSVEWAVGPTLLKAVVAVRQSELGRA